MVAKVQITTAIPPEYKERAKKHDILLTNALCVGIDLLTGRRGDIKETQVQNDDLKRQIAHQERNIAGLQKLITMYGERLDKYEKKDEV